MRLRAAVVSRRGDNRVQGMDPAKAERLGSQGLGLLGANLMQTCESE